MMSWFAGNHRTDTDCPSRTTFLAHLAQLRAAGLRTTSRQVKPSTPADPQRASEAGSATAPRISGDCRGYKTPPTQFGIAMPPKRTYTEVLGYRQSLKSGPRLCRACKQVIPQAVIDRNHQATACSDECRQEVRRADKNAMRRRWRARRTAEGNPVRQGKKRRMGA